MVFVAYLQQIDSLSSACKKNMNLKWTTFLLAFLMISGTVMAQTISSDSIKALNNNTKLLKMALLINDQKLEMAKLQNEFSQKKDDLDKAAKASQKSADSNQNTATALSNDDQNKSKAKAARRSARKAERNSSKARKAQDKLDDLTKDMDKLKKEIADNEQKVNGMGGSRYLN
jgi:chromosome segregation ATPase